MQNCANCGQSLSAEFCGACGQRRTDGRLSGKELLHDGLAHFFSLSSPLLKTIRRATRNPGELAKAYIAGTRKSLYSPIRYYLFALALHLIVRTLIGFSAVDNQYRMRGINPPQGGNLPIGTQAGHLVSEYINLFNLLFILLLALLAWQTSWRSKWNYVENLAVVFYAYGQYLLVAILFVLLAAYVDPRLLYLNYVFLVIYFPLALAQFHDGSRLWGYLRGILLVSLSYVATIFAAFWIAILYLKLTAGNP